MYKYDPIAHRYRDIRGRFVAWSEVRRSLFALLDRARSEAVSVGRGVQAGTISLEEAAREMRRIIKSVDITSTELAKGGRGNVTAADWGRAGARIKEQYRYLRDRLAKVARGEPGAMGRLPNNLAAYVQHGAEVYDRVEILEMQIRGADETRTLVSKVADHCRPGKRPGCVEEQRRGWHPYSEAVAIGQRQCLKGCKCRREHRNSSTGQIWK